MLPDVDVAATLIPVVCSWALLNDDPLASSIRNAAHCCLLRRFAMTALERASSAEDSVYQLNATSLDATVRVKNS